MCSASFLAQDFVSMIRSTLLYQNGSTNIFLQPKISPSALPFHVFSGSSPCVAGYVKCMQNVKLT